MTPHERFLVFMRFEPVDRPPLWEWGLWPTTLRRWRQEGLAENAALPQHSECENKTLCGVDLWMLPRYEARVLEENERYVVQLTDRGIVERVMKSPDKVSMPDHLEYPVKSRADWEDLKPRFDPSHPDRFPADWKQRCEKWRETGPLLVFQGPRSPSLFGFVRELMGPERALYAFCDEPELVGEMMDTITELTLAVLARVLDEAPLTSLFFWEDMCYRRGPLISPAMFRELMIPRYRRVTGFAASRGVDVNFVDSDGEVSLLIPLWAEAGIRGVYPMEVAAGMDVLALRRQYGRDLLMTGGIDKRVLAQGRDAIDAELEAKIPLAAEGGYIPHIDHSIPHDVPYDRFVYYWERKKELLGVA